MYNTYMYLKSNSESKRKKKVVTDHSTTPSDTFRVYVSLNSERILFSNLPFFRGPSFLSTDLLFRNQQCFISFIQPYLVSKLGERRFRFPFPSDSRFSLLTQLFYDVESWFNVSKLSKICMRVRLLNYFVRG